MSFSGLLWSVETSRRGKEGTLVVGQGLVGILMLLVVENFWQDRPRMTRGKAWLGGDRFANFRVCQSCGPNCSFEKEKEGKVLT